jgi:hypothetical protein
VAVLALKEVVLGVLAAKAATSGGSFISEVGLPAVVAAVISGGMIAWSTFVRDRNAARREWLDAALRLFYGPVDAKLELVYQTNVAVQAERDAETKPREPGAWQMEYERHLVRANINAKNEIARIVEEHLHYAVDKELRDSAVRYLRDATLDEWRRDATGLEITETVVVMFPDHVEEREPFHALVHEAAKRMGEEFRKLSGGNRHPKLSE